MKLMKPLAFSWQRATVTAAATAFLLTLSTAGHAQSKTTFSVVVTQPTNSATFVAPTNIPIVASVSDPASDVAYVLFTAGPPAGSLGPVLELGVVSNFISLDATHKSYELDWTNALDGTWLLVATAVGGDGATAASTPVEISVSNHPSLWVNINDPTNGAIFPGPTNITLFAEVAMSSDLVSNLEFFDGLQPLGVSSNFIPVDPPGNSPSPLISRIYIFDWTNQSPGSHVLTASATDMNGAAFWSEPVTVFIGNITNVSLTVNITNPTNGATFVWPTNIGMVANVVLNNLSRSANWSFSMVPSFLAKGQL